MLPAGSPHRRATELLASEHMASLLQELASQYPDRIIIFDSPPLLATTEARVLATHMGQVVMVIAADSTTRHAVNQALATVENCDIVLMMLNKASNTDVGAYYGYYADDGPALARDRHRADGCAASRARSHGARGACFGGALGGVSSADSSRIAGVVAFAQTWHFDPLGRVAGDADEQRQPHLQRRRAIL